MTGGSPGTENYHNCKHCGCLIRDSNLTARGRCRNRKWCNQTAIDLAAARQLREQAAQLKAERKYARALKAIAP